MLIMNLERLLVGIKYLGGCSKLPKCPHKTFNKWDKPICNYWVFPKPCKKCDRAYLKSKGIIEK